MRVLIACEFSGRVRDAFAKRGHEAWSCDLLPSDTAGNHIQGDVIPVLRQSWDLLIAHPPCTRLCVSGARWFRKYRNEQREAANFFLEMFPYHIKKICVENPIGVMSSIFRKPSQIIQPWQFGHGETKATCLWLLGLPDLCPTDVVAGREARIHKMPPSKDRGRLRSITYQGIADAMAEQWGPL